LKLSFLTCNLWLERSHAKLVDWVWFSVRSYQRPKKMVSAASLL